MHVDVTRMPISSALRLGLLAVFLVAAGCSDSATGDKRDDPSLKAYMKSTEEMYKAKMQQMKNKKGNPESSKRNR